MSHGDQGRGVHQQGPAGHCQGQKPVPMGTNTFLLLKFGDEMSSSYSFTCLNDCSLAGDPIWGVMESLRYDCGTL